MQKIEITDAPPASSTYLLDDGRYIRVHLRLLTPEADLATADWLDVETTAYEVNKKGDFVVDNNGEPVMLPRQRSRIPLENIRKGLDSAQPGWVVQDLAYDPDNPREDVKDVRQLATVPKTGKPGDRVYAKDTKLTYAYVEGQYELARQRRAGQLASVTPAATVAPLTQAQVDALKV